MMDHVGSEAGTLLYQLLEDPNDADVAYMYELYADRRRARRRTARSDVMKADHGRVRRRSSPAAPS